MKLISAIMNASLFIMGTTAMAQSNPVPTENGNRYVPYEERTGDESIVYFTRKLSAEGLIKAYEQVNANIKGHTGVKLHTGEQNGPNIIPREWVKALIDKDLPDASIVETNTYYEGDRYTTEQHRRTIEVNGWTFCPVDIMDEEDTLTLPVNGGKWFKEMSVGSHTTDYNSLVVLTHFKGHTKGGFGGSNKNIGIGFADGRIGKAWIHTTPGQDDQWDISEEEFMERMTESTKAVIDYFGRQISYVNVMRNMSVSCDCEGVNAAPVVTPNVGILSSTDILALDQACVDLVYAMTEAEHHDMVERIESRHGLRQLSYMKEMGMGNDRYILIDLDNGGKRITAAEAVKGLKPFVSDNSMTQERIKQTAGRDQLGEFAPKFAELNDDVLFGEVWSRTDKLGLRDRSLVTITSLISQGITDNSLTYHLQSAKNNGITRTEISEIITHIGFYAGWPKAWAAFRLAKDVWAADTSGEDAKAAFQREMIFPIGEPNTAYAQYFTGNSYLAPVSSEQVKIFNVTFEPGCHNNWHIHHAAKGGGQMLIGVAGRGWYQEEGKPAVEILPGTVIHIPANIKHWHGAAADCWFAHLAIEIEGEKTSNEWLEPVSPEEYGKLG